MNCSHCKKKVVLLQKGTLWSKSLDDVGILFHGEIWCRQCIDDLVTAFTKAVKMGNEEPPDVPNPDPPVVAVAA